MSVLLLLTLLTALVGGTCSAFVSRPDIVPVTWNITYTAPGADISVGSVFIAQRVVEPLSIAIYTQDGELVYYDQPANVVNASNGAFNWRPQALNGQDVLTYWEGWAEVSGYGKGRAIVLANNYTVLANVSATNGSDFHESRITRNGTMITTVYNALSDVDTTSYSANGSTTSFVQDGCFQELSLPGGDVLFSFCSLEAGVPINASYVPILAPPTTADASYDYIHVNCVDKDELGNYLLSGRHTHTLYYISGATGAILWQLGGMSSNFSGSGNAFAYQHNALFAREVGATAADLASSTSRYITIFDNGSDGTDNNETVSKGMLVEVNLANMTATALQNFTNPGGETDLLAISQGSFELYGSDTPSPNGQRVFMGYGSLPVMAEWDANGTALQVIHWGEDTSQSYRVFKSPTWRGSPLTAPDAALADGILYVSWNGATEVASWNLTQGGNMTQVPRTGFETAIALNQTATDSIQVIALDDSGAELARSQMIAADGTLTGQGAVNGSQLGNSADVSTTPGGSATPGGGSTDDATSTASNIFLSLLASLALAVVLGV